MQRIALLALSALALLYGEVDDAMLQPAQMQEDLRVLRGALEEAHGGLYRYSSKSEQNELYERAREPLNQPLPILTFAGILSELLAVVRDGHMRLDYDNASAAALAQARLLPLRVVCERERVIITHNDTPANSTIQPGMELLSVNGKSATDITSIVLPKISGDGFIKTGKTWRIGRDFAQYYWLFVDQSSTFAVTARANDGATVQARLDGVTKEERAKAANPISAVAAANLAKIYGSRETISLTFPQRKVGLLRIHAFDGESFLTSLAAAFARLREEKASALILDLRGNGGGVDQYGAALVSQFRIKSFRYFEHIRVTTVRPSFATWKPKTFEDLKDGSERAPDGGFLILPKLHPGVGVQTAADAPFSGRLFVLIDGGTFSTAADVCAHLRSSTKAVFLGEETGGAFEGNTSGLNALVVLPNSGLKLKVQMYGYWNAVTGGQHGRGTMPDIPVLANIPAALAGEDVLSNRALAMASK